MDKISRDKIFEEEGFTFIEEVSMCVGIWKGKDEYTFIIAKTCGSWDNMSIYTADVVDDVLQYEEDNRGINFKIISELQLKTILQSLT
jgi:hypothetical protein